MRDVRVRVPPPAFFIGRIAQLLNEATIFKGVSIEKLYSRISPDYSIGSRVPRRYVGEVTDSMLGKGIVYILQNPKESYYIGSTNNLVRRIEEHLRGDTKSIRHKGPWVLVFFKEYESVVKARQIEYKLKKLKRKDIIKRIITEQEIKLGA